MSRRSLRLLAVPPVTAALALLAWAGPTAPSAKAADTVTIPLDPAYVEVSFPSEQNGGPARVEIPQRQHEFHNVEARWGGTVTVTMPPQKVDTGHVGASLTFETADGTYTGGYSTDPAAPAEDRLTMTSLGDNRYRVELPADNGTNGPIGRLWIGGLEMRPGMDVLALDPTSFMLHLSAEGPAAVQLDQQTVAVSCPPGRPESGGCAPPPALTAGARVRVTLPMTSRLRALGLTGLRNSAFALQPRDPHTWPSPLPGTNLRATVSTSDGATATMTVPAGTAPGPYQFTAVVGNSTGQMVSITALNVVAAPTASATPSIGGGAPPSSTPSSGAAPAGGGNDTTGPNPAGIWVALGAVGVLAAGSAVAVVQYRHHHPHRHRPA